MKDIEMCTCGDWMHFQAGAININFGALKQRPHRTDAGGTYVGHYECTHCGKLWVTTTLKRFKRGHVVNDM